MMRNSRCGETLLFSAILLLLAACVPRPAEQQEANTAHRTAAVAAFGTVQQVFQHPRCQNCHIPGDSPLQFDAGIPHAMNIVRGPDGKGARGFACVSCHGEANSPTAFGPKAPPGAPHWQLPPPEHKMAWIGLPPKQLCAAIKDRKFNGERDLVALLKHVSEDKLVLWGWNPGGQRAPVPVPHPEFVSKFSVWAAAGGPCPDY